MDARLRVYPDIRPDETLKEYLLRKYPPDGEYRDAPAYPPFVSETGPGRPTYPPSRVWKPRD